MTKPTIICLTPVKNEAWILERFLRCASLWADVVIVADQRSEDNSGEIARSFDKVMLVDNNSGDYNEREYRRVLLDAARRIPGPRLLVALDADEFLTANFADSAEWRGMPSAAPGTVFDFKWANVLPGVQRYWSPHATWPWAYMDDGQPIAGDVIHSRRIPESPMKQSRIIREVKFLHYQYADWPRMVSKHRWYQCYERITHPAKRAAVIYRQYHHMDAVPAREIKPIPPEWLSGYTERHIDMFTIPPPQNYWWDREVILMLQKHGSHTFHQIDIWDVDWAAKAQQMNIAATPQQLRDPRSAQDKAILQLLRKTQPYARSAWVKLLTRALKFIRW
jgi:hypothetical protein